MIAFMSLNTPEIPDPRQILFILVLNKIVWFLEGSRGSDFDRWEESTNMKKFWSGSGRSGVFQIIICTLSRKVFLTKIKNIETPRNVNSHNCLIFPLKIKYFKTNSGASLPSFYLHFYGISLKKKNTVFHCLQLRQ